MSFIYISSAVPGTCYQDEDGTYLGKFKEKVLGDVFTEGYAAGQQRQSFVFEKKTIDDSPYRPHKVKEVPCETGGKRRTRNHKRKHTRKFKKTQKRRRY
jgi:hypothetical protein